MVEVNTQKELTLLSLLLLLLLLVVRVVVLLILLWQIELKIALVYKLNRFNDIAQAKILLRGAIFMYNCNIIRDRYNNNID